MKVARLALVALACCASLQAQGAPVIRIPFETYILPNGLTVILSLDRTTPTVAVNMWYHVGSKNEVAGRTGFAHLFEHVMFTGSGHVPYGLHDKLTEGVGGSNNGSTSNDATTYYETVPSNYLESALWIESDRMGFLLDSLDLAKLNAQRDVVKNERRQRMDNQPYGRVSEILARATYPPSHPYSWDVIGSMEDLSAASEEDVKNFFRLYYAPNNAFVTIVGDFDPAQTKAWVAKYFGDIPRGKAIERPSAPPVTLPRAQRLVFEDRVQVPRVYVLWPTVGEKSDDRLALDVLGAVLTGPRTARLTKALVYDSQAAAAVSARQNSNEDVGEFVVSITPRPAHSLVDLEGAMDAVVDRLKADGPTAEEVQKATAGQELAFVRGLESNLGKAFQLVSGAGFHGDPGYFRTEYENAGGDAGRRQTGREQVPDGRSNRLERGPRRQTRSGLEARRKPGRTMRRQIWRRTFALLLAAMALAFPLTSGFSPAFAQQPLDRTKIPAPGKSPALRVPTWTRSTLSNGAEIVVSEKHDLPLVSFSINFLGGADQFEPPGLRGVGPLTTAMMSEGTKTRDGDALSNALQLLGTSITVTVGGESGSLRFTCTTSTFAATMDILADMLLNPALPAESLERLRAQRLVALNQAKAQSGSISARVFPRILYGDQHPFGRSATEESIKAITRADVAAFHQAYFRPGRAIVTIVGDVRAAAVKPVVEHDLAGWLPGGDKPSFLYPSVPAPNETTIFLVDKPEAPQSTFAIGIPGPPRNTPDYFALQVMNTILGGQFQSRLNANIREQHGYSYGVNSSFAFGRGPGPFRAGGDVVREKTDAALVEFMKELRGITGTRPVTDDELGTAKAALVQGLPATFASVSSINSAITGLWTQNLPDDYYQRYAGAISAVTGDDVVRVARKYVDLDHLAIVIVGDRATIEAPLKATAVAPIVLLDIDGNPAK